MQGPTTQLRTLVVPASGIAIAIALVVLLVRSGLRADESPVDGPTEREPIEISADVAHEWVENDVRIVVMRGHCLIKQGAATLRAQKMVLWQATRSGRDALALYLEDDVVLEYPGKTDARSSLMINLATREGVTYQYRHRMQAEQAMRDSLYERAVLRRNTLRRNAVTQTQYTVPAPAETGADPGVRSVQIPPPAENVRRIRVYPRGSLGYSYASEISHETTPPLQVTVVTGGVILMIDGVSEMGTIDLEADRMVIWMDTSGDQEWDLTAQEQTREKALQVYMEGDIVIRHGQGHSVTAERAFYDAREDNALILDGEIKAYIPEIDSDLRVRAARIRQISSDQYHAQTAWVSTSRFGKPGYRIQATDIFVENRYSHPWFTPMTFDPLTGEPIVEPTPWVTSLNNTFFVGDVPLLYTPHLTAPAEDPHIPLRRAKFQQDDIFGTQVATDWDMFKLLGMERPRNADWLLHADYLSRRGPAVGTGGEYEGVELFGIPGIYQGEGDLYYVWDGGEDNLGLDRRDLIPESESRGRIRYRHRHELPYGLQAIGEVGYVSDRNFLEQYFENEFDREKDQETLLYLKQRYDNAAFTGLLRPQVNDFENTTAWLPRGDVYFLGEPLLGGWLTWSSHSSAGYAQLNQAEPPTDPNDIFSPLPYFADADGAVLMTRNELNAPFTLGPVNVVPYVMGEAAYWGDDSTGRDIDRYVARAGVRGSVMFWRVLPYVRSYVFNVNGLAHKMLIDADFAWTDSSRSLMEIPQFNEFDDNAQERFRQRFLVNTFGGMLPTMFDPRGYAVRTGAGASVTAPWHELIDDQVALRMGWRHRLQTKVGPPDRLRIRDWMTLDLEASFFPDAERDNFGEDFGLLGGRYKWQVGERTSLLASAYYDLFDDAQQLWNVGLVSQRSARGSVLLSLRQVKGAGLDSQIASASYSYYMSPKWISTLGTSYDLGEQENRGQSLTVTRVGADFLIHVGTNIDASKGNTGFAISVEPRIGNFGGGSMSQLGSLLQTN